MIPSLIAHEGGIAMDLTDGNSGLGIEGDDIHGTHDFMTYFRNLMQGDVCNCPTKNGNTTIAHFWAFDRYVNAVGNVFGQPGTYYSSYQTGPGSSTAKEIYSLGQSDGENSVPNDPVALSTIMRWGNYDMISGAVRWCGNSSDTGWASTCNSISEVPAGLSAYANSVPTKGDTQIGQGTMSASLYLSAKPSFFGATTLIPNGTPWPPIGPDVSGGNVNGSGGHAYSIPAQTCFNNSPADSSYSVTSGNPVISFNAAKCYGTGGSTAGLPAPSGLKGTVSPN